MPATLMRTVRSLVTLAAFGAVAANAQTTV